jgi:VanZ family protein
MNPFRYLSLNRRVSAVLAILWMYLIFFISSVPGSDFPMSFGHYSLIFHFIQYFVLGILASSVFSGKSYFLPILFCIFFGLFDEIYQSFVPGRTASFLDVFVDFLGGAAGVFFFRWGEAR